MDNKDIYGNQCGSDNAFTEVSGKNFLMKETFEYAKERVEK